MSDIEATEAMRRAREGEAFLDDHPAIPRNWPTLINPESLDMRSGIYCVIGQILGGPQSGENKYGDFSDAHLDDYSGSEYGFIAGPIPDEERVIYVGAPALAAAWVTIVDERQRGS